MSPGGVKQDLALSELKRLCHSGRGGPELLRAVAERLRQLSRSEAYCASTVDPGSALITHALTGEMGGEREAAVFLDHLYFEHDLDQIRRMTRERRPVARLSELSGGDITRSPRYREMLRPLGLAHEMRAVFTAGGHVWGTLDLSREAGRPDFEPREVAFVRRLAPHLGAGLKAAALCSQALAEGRTGTDVPGVLVLDHRGRVAHYTAAAERWLEEIEDLKPGWSESQDLPPAVRMVAGALRRALRPENAGDLDLLPRLNVRARSGRWLSLYGSLSEGLPAEAVIVIGPAGPGEVVRFNMAAYGLTPREAEVATLAAQGASTREISASLYISGYTVQNHLCNAFEKVGVKSRRELTRRLFLDGL